MRPLIGINCDIQGDAPHLKPEYWKAIEGAGGEPMLLDPRKGTEGIERLLRELDGLMLSGGRDIWPKRYRQPKHLRTNLVSEARDRFDFELAGQALAMDMPILGICLGMQLINVVMRGSLIQDIPSQSPSRVSHNSKIECRHEIKIEGKTKLHAFLGRDYIEVNSSHHQAIDRLGEGLRVSARAEDGIIEAIESTKHSLVIGVQWHPERMLEDAIQRGLFTAFLREVRDHAPGK
jgi:putative glutamine amidotransferase